MSNDIMTPDEIEKLLQSVGELQSSQPYSLDLNDYLSADECDMLGEIGNICMGTSATALYDLLEHKVMITTPSVSVQTQELMMQEYPAPIVSVGVHYTEGIEGDSVLLLKEYDAALITDLLIGGDGNIDPYDVNLEELQLSAIREVMNQLVGASATSLADLLGQSVNISTPVSKRILIGDDSLKEIISGDVFVKISFKMEIENLLSSEIMQIWSLDFAKKLCEMMMLAMTGEAPAPKPAEEAAQATPDDFLMSNAAQSRNVSDLQTQYNAATETATAPAPEPAPVQTPVMEQPAPQPQTQPQQPQYPGMDAQMPPQVPPQMQQMPQQQMPQQPQMQQQPYGYPPQQYPGMDPNQPQMQPQMPQQPYGYPPQQYPGMDPNQPQMQQPYGYPPYGYPPYGYPPYGYPQQPAQPQQPTPQEIAAAAGFAAAQQAHHTHQIISSGGADSDKVKEVLYPEFDSVHIPKMEVPSDNLNLIMKVPVEVSVVLGKKRLKIKEVLDFNAGTVVVLDKIAGEAVDILVNGTAVAKGEVVVVDDNYGVRITEINTAQLIDSL